MNAAAVAATITIITIVITVDVTIVVAAERTLGHMRLLISAVVGMAAIGVDVGVINSAVIAVHSVSANIPVACIAVHAAVHALAACHHRWR